MEISFLSDTSYEPIASGPAPQIEWPALVPLLDMGKMQENLKKIWEIEQIKAMKVTKSPQKLQKKALSADCKMLSEDCSCSSC